MTESAPLRTSAPGNCTAWGEPPAKPHLDSEQIVSVTEIIEELAAQCCNGDTLPAIAHICVDNTRVFKPAIKELNFKKSLNLREVDDVEFKVAGLAYRYDDASVDGLRSLSSRLCKCCQVLCAVKRRNSRRTP